MPLICTITALKTEDSCLPRCLSKSGRSPSPSNSPLHQPHWLSGTDLLFWGQRIGQPALVTHTKSPHKVSLLIDKWQTSLHEADGMCQRARVKGEGGLKIIKMNERKNITYPELMIFFFLFLTSSLVINTSTRLLSGHHGVLSLGFIKHITTWLDETTFFCSCFNGEEEEYSYYSLSASHLPTSCFSYILLSLLRCKWVII